MPPMLLFDPRKVGRPMRVAGFMSGSGTNIKKMLEFEKSIKRQSGSCPFEVVFIFSDRSDGRSRGEALAREAGIPFFSYDIRRFYELRNAKRTVKTSAGFALRREYDEAARTLVNAFGADVVALGGYMSYTTLNRCVNVHPADLTILDDKGCRVLVGDDAVLDAIRAGHKVLRASTLWTDEGVDTGPLLMVSRPLPVTLPLPLEELLKKPAELRRTADDHQQRLKEVGDWEILPRTILMIAEGRVALDDNRKVFIDGQETSFGVIL